MAGAIKAFINKASNHYSFDGEKQKLITHRNPLTLFKKHDFEHTIKIMKRDLLTRRVPDYIKRENIKILLKNESLSQGEIVYFLRSGRFTDRESMLADALDTAHIVQVLTCFDAANFSQRPIESLMTRGRIAMKLDGENLLTVLKDYMEIGFGDGASLEEAFNRLQPLVNLETAVALAKIKTENLQLINRELKKMLLESALKKELGTITLFDFNMKRKIAEALHGTGSSPHPDGSGTPSLFEIYLKTIGNITLKERRTILDDSMGVYRKVALRVLFAPENTEAKELSEFLSIEGNTYRMSNDERMHIVNLLIGKRAYPEMEAVLANYPKMPHEAWFALKKACIDLYAEIVPDSPAKQDRTVSALSTLVERVFMSHDPHDKEMAKIKEAFENIFEYKLDKEATGLVILPKVR